MCPRDELPKKKRDTLYIEVVSLHCTRYGVNGAARGKHQRQEFLYQPNTTSEINIKMPKKKKKSSFPYFLSPQNLISWF